MTEITAKNENQSPKALKDYLQVRTLRSRTGVLLVPPDQLMLGPEIAARLAIDLVDYAQVILAAVPPRASLLGITADAEQARLDRIAEAPNGTDVVLVTQFDLALAHLSATDRVRLWRVLREGFPHRRRALLLVIPEGAHRLLPEGVEWLAWQDGQRVALWTEDEIVTPSPDLELPKYLRSDNTFFGPGE